MVSDILPVRFLLKFVFPEQQSKPSMSNPKGKGIAHVSDAFSFERTVF